ncbi:molybdopterin molybdotransferase MoeA [Pseudarthrobacter sp. J1763]|uniref:molybdopterin molybdotransferase MoeA n=1 Tax=Pseudarthrobacter sp. J1763 TaxID=3420445 RepID=UPI003D2A15A6
MSDSAPEASAHNSHEVEPNTGISHKTAHKTLAHNWYEARELAYNHPQPLPPSLTDLDKCVGRTLTEDLVALHNMPHYASSAMDGWAVNGTGPWIPVEPGKRLAPHEASPIVTGGLIPPGAKAVLRSESAELTLDEDGLAVVRLGGRAKPGEPRNGQHIRRASEEASVEDMLIPAGTVINPAQVALAALAGHDQLPVVGRAVVRFLRTGSEVVDHGIPAPGRVRDTFGPQIPSVITQLGGIYAETLHVEDHLDHWRRAFDEEQVELPSDVVITTGGTGASATDHLRSVLEELGARFLIDTVAMRPGHPTVLAELPDGRYVLGLPGNPTAAMVALLSFGWPLIAKLGHLPAPAVVQVPCGTSLDAHQGPTRVMPFRQLYGMAAPSGHHSPGMMRGLAMADGLMIVPPHGVQMGELVDAISLPWATPLEAAESAEEKVAKEAAAKEQAAKERAAKAARRKAASTGPVDWSALG